MSILNRIVAFLGNPSTQRPDTEDDRYTGDHFTYRPDKEASLEPPEFSRHPQELVQDARLRKKVFAAIEAEWHRTAEALTLITGDKQRLADNSALARSIKHRFPYIDPLHHLQVELVRRWRAGQDDERVQTGIHISINGIAAGLRNTG